MQIECPIWQAFIALGSPRLCSLAATATKPAARVPEETAKPVRLSPLLTNLLVQAQALRTTTAAVAMYTVLYGTAPRMISRMRQPAHGLERRGDCWALSACTGRMPADYSSRWTLFRTHTTSTASRHRQTGPSMM